MCSQASSGCSEWVDGSCGKHYNLELIVTIIVVIENSLLEFEVLPCFRFSLAQTGSLFLTGVEKRMH